jgi:hypothetical protein
MMAATHSGRYLTGETRATMRAHQTQQNATAVSRRTKSSAPWTGQTGWHIASWGPWGWAETIVKLAGVAVALAAALEGGAASTPATHRVPYWILFAVAVGYIGTVIDRLIDRELIAIGFVLLMLLGHWSMAYAMGRPAWPTSSVRTFAALMLVGDLIKIGYFVTTRTRVRTMPWTTPTALTGALVVAYAATLVAS